MNLQTVILAAGRKQLPKNTQFISQLILRSELTLLELAIDTYKESKSIILALDKEEFKVVSKVSLPANVSLIAINGPTLGALASTGICLDLLTDDSPIVISSIDGLCPNLAREFMEMMTVENADGGIVVFPSANENYSYVRTSKGFPIEIAEKQRISDLATAGIFYFKNKRLLTESIKWAILNKVTHDNLYYISSAMNKLIIENKRVSLFEIPEIDYFRFSTDAEVESSIKRMEQKEIG